MPFNHTAQCHATHANRTGNTQKIQFNHLHNEIMYTLNDGNAFYRCCRWRHRHRCTYHAVCVRATSKNKQYKIIITAVFFLQKYGNLLSVNAEL